MKGNEDPASGAWHVDKRIPLALIITLAVAFIGQTFAFGWFGAAMNARLETVERAQQVSAPQGDRLTRVEVRIENIAEGIQRIERTLQERVRPN